MPSNAPGIFLPKNKTDSQQFLSIKEVGERTGASYDTVRRWISRGQLRAYYFSKRMIRIDWDDVLAMREEVNPATFEHVSGGGR